MPQFRLPIILAVLVLAVLGCGGKKEVAAPTTKDSKPKDTGTPTLPTAAVVNNDEAKAAALKAATDFVKAVQEGKAISASLTLAFKKVIAPPELEADKAIGYSEHEIEAWLTGAKSIVSTDDPKVDFATAEFAIVSMAGKTGRSRLRMLRQGNTWLVDLPLLNNMSANFSMPVGEPAAPAFGALAFVSALQGGNVNQVEALLSKAAKGKLAPPLFESDKEQGYSRSNLKTALRDLFRFPVEIEKLSVTGASASFEVTDPKPLKRFDLKLIPGATPGEYLIDDLQQK